METAAALVRSLGPRSRAARVAMTGAALWGLSALVHTAVFVVDGESWSGSVSWRKPIVFSLSVGSLMWAVGWVIDRLPRHRPRLAAWIAWGFVLSGSVETGLIAAQTWRGRPSHFNTFEPVDAAVFGLMGVMVGVMSLALLALTVWALVERPAEPTARTAVLAGLAMVVMGLGVGQWIVDLGVRFTAEHGVVPDVVLSGEAGVAKFPHAVAFHGIHVLAILVALCGARGVDGRRPMRLAATGAVTVLIVATLQTVAGAPPLRPGPVLGAAMVAGIAAIALGFAAALLPLGTGRRAAVAAGSAGR